jgi:glucose/arabinose dehydrogenase
MDVHPVTGIVWTNEHGPRGGDELNVQDKPGANYGWPVISYGINYDGSILTEETEKEGMEQPVTYYDPSIAPSGMTFVTGNTYPGWEGNIMIGALRFQLLSRVVLDGDEFVKEERLLEGIGRIRDVVQAPDGFIYFSNESEGTIHRILPVE